MFTRNKDIPQFYYRSEAFDYMFAQLVKKGKDMMDAAKQANEFADIIATNKKLPDAPPPPMNALDKGMMYLKQISAIKKENPEIWDMVTSAASGIIGGFSGSATIETPIETSIDFTNLD